MKSTSIHSLAEASFVIQTEQAESIKRAYASLQGTYQDDKELTLLLGGHGAGFLIGCRWLAEAVFHAMNRDNMLAGSAPPSECLYLIEAALMALEDNSSKSSNLTKAGLQ